MILEHVDALLIWHPSTHTWFNSGIYTMWPFSSFTVHLWWYIWTGQLDYNYGKKRHQKSVNVNKDTVCCNLDVQNICFFVCFFIIDCKNTLKQKNQSSNNKSHLLNTEKLLTGSVHSEKSGKCWMHPELTLQQKADLLISIWQNEVVFLET